MFKKFIQTEAASRLGLIQALGIKGEMHMQFCGIEIKGSEAIIAIALLHDGHFSHVSAETKRIALDGDDDAANVRSFADLIAGFMRDRKISNIAVKKRAKKGEFAGGPTTFKIEGILQLLKDCRVELISAQTIAARDRRHSFPSPASLNKYQAEAFRTACAALAKAAEE
ncbi:DUF3010 family protein [Xanthomonas euroxanthea]|uniref:DUF3010 family protein n=1 Tax=Xanthomonas euroxanthea TaxID=2259622 RepID=UPI001BB04675|nr:DUF3010 family protein [Xanthomonas euroxanthea]